MFYLDNNTLEFIKFCLYIIVSILFIYLIYMLICAASKNNNNNVDLLRTDVLNQYNNAYNGYKEYFNNLF